MSALKPVRLDKLLANLGYGSRREIAELARRGRIRLDGVALRRADEKVMPDAALQAGLQVDGEPIDPLPPMTLMLNKPTGVTCSRKDAGEIVFDLLPDRWRMRDPALNPIGRLDRMSSGLLLLTDDGQLSHRVTSPRHDTPKRYRVTLDRPLDGREAALFASGEMMLDGEDKPLLPATLETTAECEALITIHEGRYHQVRRMFAAAGNHVLDLHRDRIGGLALPADLQPGEWRVLDAQQADAIFQSDAANPAP